jgi:hypothetical protein
MEFSLPDITTNWRDLVGTFHYADDFQADFEDRVLAHLQIVIGAKLRRGEAFYLSWRDHDSVGNGRTTVWLHPALPLRYKYYGGRMPRINPAWIHDLSISANTPGGLQLVAEPAPPLEHDEPTKRTGTK